MKWLSLLLSLSVAAVAADVPFQARIQYIEACSCNLFCQCYFVKLALHKHTGSTICSLNTVARVQSGKYGSVDLTGIKYWVAAEFESDKTKGQASWGALTLDPQISKEQMEDLSAILDKMHPKWKSYELQSPQEILP
jgi:hypothetical protein